MFFCHRFLMDFDKKWSQNIFEHFSSKVMQKDSLLAQFSTLSAPFFMKSLFFWYPSPRITCRLPFASLTKEHFRLHPDLPRPGAGILPQATEIRSGPWAPEACWDSRTALRTTFALHLHLAPHLLLFRQPVLFFF